jgi:cyclopropane fatty-acyl-phospholipid synthase-like methyltransferase
VATLIQPVADVLCDSVDLKAGWRVLDVACGSGNAAIAAARCDCDVIGID